MAKDSRPRWVQARTNSWTYSMFVETADQNYVLARWAFGHRMYFDFYWLIAQAVEKYLKAVLLLNGRKAKHYGHRIEELRKEVLKLDPQVQIQPFKCPPVVDPSLWHDETVEHFFKRLADIGNPNNRYALHGYSMATDDLFKTDQLVFALRRLCQPFSWSVGQGAKVKLINQLDLLANNPTYWKLQQGLVEKLLNLDLAAASPSEADQANALRRMNYAFDHTCTAGPTEWSFASQEPVLADTYRILVATKDGGEDGAAGALDWALKSVALNGRTQQQLQDAIDIARGVNRFKIVARRVVRNLRELWNAAGRAMFPPI